MLLELTIKNFAVIKEITIPFHKGLTILTGETGAGKSILIDAIGLLLGGRGSGDYIRHGCKKAEIEGLFEFEADSPAVKILNKHGIECEDQLVVVRREITESGKSLCRVNGRLIPQSIMREIGPWFITVHGQHEHQSLMQEDRHIQWLDSFGEEQLAPTLKEYSKLYKRYLQLRSELEYISTNEREMVQRMDMLRFQLKEIVDASLEPGEDEKLLAERKRLSGGEKLARGIGAAYHSLSGEQRGMDWLSNALENIEPLLSFDPSLEKIHKTLEEAYYQIEDVARSLRQLQDEVQFDPERLAIVESRLDEINRLKRKYGKTVDEILEYAASIEDELDNMENRENRIEELQKQVREIGQDLAIEARELSEIRKRVAMQLAFLIEKELKELHMSRTQFEIAITREPDEKGLDIHGEKVRFTAKGIDQVEFMISPNPGEPLRPLARIASGGELSRIMLAMKTILAHSENIDTLIFDEVDTGVSGRVAQAIAEKLYRVAKRRQVLCVTHLPQVASMADHHLYIVKHMGENETETRVTELNEEEKVQELARMLGGVEVTDKTLAHARDMLLQANLRKKEDIVSQR